MSLTGARSLPGEDVFAAGSLLRAAQQAHDRLWQELVPGGYTSPQFAVLHRLRVRPGIDQNTLGETAGFDKAGAAELTARLQSVGLISRERTAEDGRRNALHLTPEGLAAFTAIAPWVAQVQLRLTSMLDGGETERLLRLLGTAGEVVSVPHGTAPTLIGLPSDPARIPGHLIRVAQQRHNRCWAAAVGPVPTSPQYGVLYRVAREPGIDQTTLADRVSLAKAPAGQIVKRLAERGEVVRSFDPADARRRLLNLSDSGWHTLSVAMPGVLAVQHQLTEGLSPNERGELLTLLARVAQA